MTDSAGEQRFESFADFYPFYLEEHSDPRCRALHYVGSTLVLIILGYGLVSGQYVWLWLMPVVGYGCAWVGHFFFEHNRPATVKYPIYSLIGDWVMLKHFLTGRLRERHPALD